MKIRLHVLVLLLVLLSCSGKEKANHDDPVITTTDSIKNVVVVSFDGSSSLTMWEDTLQFGKKYDVRFTYFISAPYFITKEEAEAHQYKRPPRRADDYPIPWRDSSDRPNIQARVSYVERAVDEGHEIGSHGVYHMKGENWTYEQWEYEMALFNKIADEVFSEDVQFHGYRAPCFSHNDSMYLVLKKFGYEYDSSFPSSRDWMVPNVVPVYPLPKLNFQGESITAMDYNFWVYHQGIKKNSELKPSYLHEYKNNKMTGAEVIRLFEESYYQALVDGYQAARKKGFPFYVGNHFELMHQGAYWRGLQRFIKYAKEEGAEFLTFIQLHRRVHGK